MGKLPCHLLGLPTNLESLALIYFGYIDRILMLKGYLKYYYFKAIQLFNRDQKVKTARFILNFAKFFEFTLNQILLSWKQTLCILHSLGLSI